MKNEEIDKEKTLSCLNTQFQDDPDKLEVLKEMIEQEEFFIDKEGNTNVSSLYIKRMKDIDLKNFSPERRCIDILISYTNYLNYKLKTEYTVEDELIKKLALGEVINIKRAILNKDTVEYWGEIEEYLMTNFIKKNHYIKE